MQKLHWGIVGAGNISLSFSQGIQDSISACLVAVASRDLAKAEAFRVQAGAVASEALAYGTYQALLDDPRVQAVYIGLPHTEHLHWTVRALRAGKHVLCEKPLGLNHAEAMIAYDEAERAGGTGRILMEAFMYRCTPQTAKLVELLRSGIVGEVRQIQSSFCYSSTPRAGSRTWEPSLAGGGILDVGCYPVSMARLVAGVASGKPFAEPIHLQAMGKIGVTGVDDWAVATLRFPNDIVAQISTAINAEQEESLRIAGTKGALVIPNPWYGAGAQAGKSEIQLFVDETLAQVWTINADQGLYAYEVDCFSAAVNEGSIAHPCMNAADSIGNLAVMDQWRAAIGLQYPKEQSTAMMGKNTLAGLAIVKRDDAVMTYAQIAGLEKGISRLVMGVDNQETLVHAAAMFDDFMERGGNAFDTAWVYDFDGGHCEQVFGDWMRSRGVRDEITLISKGAHTPNCNPEGMRREFAESLDRLQTDSTDIYILHRDNLQVPVGEFVDVLNQHVSTGKIKIFGGSNWSMDRILEANVYAKKNGLQGFSVVSNQLSLARMISPVWGGCVSAGDLASRQTLFDQGLALFAWSSQARGFFTDRAAPNRLEDEELVRCWYSPENFQRRQRAIALAAQKQVSPINIALAWVLGQNFPCFSLIGPRTIQETASSMRGLTLQLSAEEMAWLDLAMDQQPA